MSSRVFPTLSTGHVVRISAAITFSLGLALLLASDCQAYEGSINGGSLTLPNHCDSGSCDGLACGGRCKPDNGSSNHYLDGSNDLSWLDSVKVGYDDGFVIASRRQLDLQDGRHPFQLKLNGWGQLRHTVSDMSPPNRDLNQFQLERGRLIFSGNAFTPDFSYFIQLDGRSSSGDDMRLLDFALSFDVGHHSWGLDPGTIGFRTGKYKMPFTMARWMSGREFEFTDRSMASTYFDVNRSLAWGLYGKTDRYRFPIVWETAIFNGLVTGGAETGSSGSLDDNFAYSARIHGFPIGDWGAGELADFEGHDRLAMRVGCGFASSVIDRSGSTEFSSLRVVDSGSTLASILPPGVGSYAVSLYSLDASFKYRGWSTTLEYYFRNVSDFKGASVPNLFDQGHWFQLGYFVVPRKLQLLTRWSRVAGNSGTVGLDDQSSGEVAGGLAWYFRGNHAKFSADATHLDGAPINSSSLDINPGDQGWLYRTQIQFSF